MKISQIILSIMYPFEEQVDINKLIVIYEGYQKPKHINKT